MRESGYTLAELMVAMLLLAFGTLGAIPMFVHAMHGNDSGASLGNVAAAAEQRLELLRSEPYVGLVPGGSISSAIVGYSDSPQPRMKVMWSITTNASPVGTKTIRVRAVQTGIGPGPARSINLIAVRGL